MNNHSNPYTVGAPVGSGSSFVGREDVLRTVVSELLNSQANVIALYGQRCIGKSSILQSLGTWLPRGFSYRTVYFDWQDKAGLPSHQIMQELGRVMARDLQVEQPAEPQTIFQTWLPELVQDSPQATPLVLLLDGLDALAAWEVEHLALDFFPPLRTLLAHHSERLKCILSIGWDLSDMTRVALSLFKTISFQHISMLNPKETADLVRLSEKKGSLQWSEDAVEQVWNLTHGHPYLTQLLCLIVWERAYKMHPGGPPPVGWADVDAAVPDALDVGQDTLAWLWDGLPLVQQVSASVLAQAGPDSLPPDQLEQWIRDSGARMFMQGVANIPQLLQDWDWLEPANGGYRFRVELLRRWVAAQKPPDKIYEDLDHSHPTAENLYRVAWGLWRNGQWEQATLPLRQALNLQPHHIGANQLLADIMVAQGYVAKAQQFLERLYERQPMAARTRLVQTLLTGARLATDEEQQLALYKRVVEIQPRHTEATTRIAEIQQVQRQRALQARLQQLAGLEQTQQYEAALDLVQWLAEEYADLRDWREDLERLKQKGEMLDLYRRALEAIQKGDRTLAQKLLIKVITIDPSYGEATRYLHLIVTNVDMAGIQAQVAADKTIKPPESEPPSPASPVAAGETAPAEPESPNG